MGHRWRSQIACRVVALDGAPVFALPLEGLAVRAPALERRAVASTNTLLLYCGEALQEAELAAGATALGWRLAFLRGRGAACIRHYAESTGDAAPEQADGFVVLLSPLLQRWDLLFKARCALLKLGYKAQGLQEKLEQISCGRICTYVFEVSVDNVMDKSLQEGLQRF